MNVVVVDYGAGNVVSVVKALAHVGAHPVLSADPGVIRRADSLVFPGQGHFGQAMHRLKETGIDRALRAAIDGNTPFLGICLGLQLLFEGSDEAPGVAGLGVFKGRCARFNGAVKVPQVGWNEVRVERPDALYGAVVDDSYFYFVHSFHAVPVDSAVVAATALHGERFCAAVARENIVATQFHPEKSGRVGLDLLAAFSGRRAAA